MASGAPVPSRRGSARHALLAAVAVGARHRLVDYERRSCAGAGRSGNLGELRRAGRIWHHQHRPNGDHRRHRVIPHAIGDRPRIGRPDRHRSPRRRRHPAGQDRPHDRLQRGRRGDADNLGAGRARGDDTHPGRLQRGHPADHRHVDAQHRWRPQRGVHLPDRVHAGHRIQQLSHRPQRRPRLQRLLAGQQLSHPRNGLRPNRHCACLDVHHRINPSHRPGSTPRSERRRDPRHQHHPQPGLRTTDDNHHAGADDNHHQGGADDNHHHAGLNTNDPRPRIPATQLRDEGHDPGLDHRPRVGGPSAGNYCGRTNLRFACYTRRPGRPSDGESTQARAQYAASCRHPRHADARPAATVHRVGSAPANRRWADTRPRPLPAGPVECVVRSRAG